MTELTGSASRTAAGTEADELEAQRLEDEQRLAEEHAATAALPERANWAPLPRRARPKPKAALFTIRTPIPVRAKWTLTVLSVALPLAIWWVLSATGAVSPTFLPSPPAVLKAGLQMASTGELFGDLWATVQRILFGFGLAVLISVPLGIVMGTFTAARALAEPIVGLVRYMPASAFILLLIIWLGIGEPSKVALLFIGTFFFNTLMVADVVGGVPRNLINVSYTLGSRRAEVLRRVIVPYSLPGIIDAIRVNVAAAWNFVVVAELVNSTAGLGYRIVRAQRFLQTDKIFAVLVVIGLSGLATDVALRLLRSKVGRWAA
ncbi:ABC transporter permease [Amycolatopsis sp. NPDC059657]|uniref:ABC transporter permease n=1 Tax=Amycolatopsis sp. NPDC059657 TaxID=3346899 RepID=UPI00366E8E4A